MSVATQLGLDDPGRDLLHEARRQWPTWTDEDPALAVTHDLLDLPAWVKHAPPADADRVLHALAVLASPRGGDDVAAAGALAWLLLPAACVTAHKLRYLTGRIDEIVAAQLWLEIRSFKWERLRKVAANITMNTRRGVLRDLGVGENGREADPTWARVVRLAPDGPAWEHVMSRTHREPQEPPGAELIAVFESALDSGALSARDRDLLVSLAVVADQEGVTRTGCGQGGLCSRRVVQVVADQEGISPSTIRRRAAASLRVLAAQIPA